MSSVVVALPKMEDAKAIGGMLERYGISVVAVCNTAAKALSVLSGMEEGILICAYRFPDMMYFELRECMPRNVDMLLLVSGIHSQEITDGILKLEMPIKGSELINTVHMMSERLDRRRQRLRGRMKIRNEKEDAIINESKLMLMAKNQWSEEDAYRYIQKNSMDTGRTMKETAQMILLMYHEE